MPVLQSDASNPSSGSSKQLSSSWEWATAEHTQAHPSAFFHSIKPALLFGGCWTFMCLQRTGWKFEAPEGKEITWNMRWRLILYKGAKLYYSWLKFNSCCCLSVIHVLNECRSQRQATLSWHQQSRKMSYEKVQCHLEETGSQKLPETEALRAQRYRADPVQSEGISTIEISILIYFQTDGNWSGLSDLTQRKGASCPHN